MRLADFTVENYRSITKASVSLGSFTVLIGQNNEGKSNLLSALVTSMELIQANARSARPNSISRYDTSARTFIWERDYPLRLQEKRPEGSTVFRLTFSLEESEIDDLDEEIGSRINGSLPLEITISKKAIEIKVIKSGKNASSLTRKSSAICGFVGSRINVNYIPAVRTENESLEVVSGMLTGELRRLEHNPEYQEALKKIAELQDPILKRLSEQITTSLRGFLPQVKNVKIKATNRDRSTALARSVSVLIDDGNATSIERKGDGIKSLAAISLLQRSGERKGFASILAIEEPESHLHPSAIHRLRAALEDTASSRQVVITTHSPSLVDRVRVANNIIISKSLARSARTVAEIRDLLGVRASDNLTHAALVLVVEGAEDKVAIHALLQRHSSALSDAVRHGTLSIDPVGGAGNLSYKLHTLYASLCPWHVLFDNDAMANQAIQKAKNDGILRDSDLTQTICGGMEESEFEDCLELALYKDRILSEFAVDLGHRDFGGRSKWSVRARRCFENQGTRWTSGVAMRVKAAVANAVAAAPERALQEQKGASIRALFGKIERRLAEITASHP